MKMHHSSESQSVTRPLMGMNRNRTAEPQRAPKFYMCAPGRQWRRLDQVESKTSRHVQTTSYEANFRMTNKCQEDIFFFLYSSKLSDFFFFRSNIFFFITSFHKLFSGIFPHFIWTLSVKRGCSCFKTVKTYFFIFILYFSFVFTCETEWKQLSERTLYFYISLYLKQEDFSLKIPFFSQENFLKWNKNLKGEFLLFHVKLGENKL